jgi:hypothetical protein
MVPCKPLRSPLGMALPVPSQTRREISTAREASEADGAAPGTSSPAHRFRVTRRQCRLSPSHRAIASQPDRTGESNSPVARGWLMAASRCSLSLAAPRSNGQHRSCFTQVDRDHQIPESVITLTDMAQSRQEESADLPRPISCAGQAASTQGWLAARLSRLV